MFFEFQDFKDTVKFMQEETAKKEIIFNTVTEELKESIKASDKNRGEEVAKQSSVNG